MDSILAVYKGHTVFSIFDDNDDDIKAIMELVSRSMGISSSTTQHRKIMKSNK